MSPKQRDASDETVVLNTPEQEQDSTAEDDKSTAEDDKSAAEDDEPTADAHKDMKNHSALINERISAQIHEAARKVIADIEREHYEDQEDSLLSAQTDESYEGGETELTHDDGTEMTYDGTEATYESEQEEQLDTYEGESQLDAHLDEALTAWEPTIETENTNAEQDQDSSSHHDGDIDDDVFSEESGRSQRSSINSVHDLNSSDEVYQKTLTSPAVGEEAATSHLSTTISRIPSATSYVADESNLRTPSKILHRPPFRTPSSVRAMQMGSPTQSIFSSPRSAKRHMPTVSRIGTPTSQYSPSKRTPTRFKAPKEKPLVLLHVTLMPLQWPFAHTMTSRDVPESLQHVKESWGLLQDKLANTVLERGILLSHPQDSYEVLEERLLEALELPVRPRAQILKCGHYMGPGDLDTASSDDESADTYFQQVAGTERKWCDICRKDVKLEETGESCGKRRFNVKIFAGNGLMRAGAWAAVWREMERVDVEIEPWVEINLRSELELLALTVPVEAILEHEGDGFVDEEDEILQEERGLELAVLAQQEPSPEEAEIRRKFEEEELAHKRREEEELNQKFLEEEMHRRLAEEEEQAQRLMDEEILRRKLIDEETLRRRLIDEEQTREIYMHQQNLHHQQQQPQQQRRAPRQVVDPDSLSELLVAAFKVLLRDKKNIAIGILSLLVLFLALRPAGEMPGLEQRGVVIGDALPRIVVDSEREVVYETARQVVKPVEVEVVEMKSVKVEEAVKVSPVIVEETKESVPEPAPEPTVDIILETSTEVAQAMKETVSELPLVVVEATIEVPLAPASTQSTQAVATEDVKVAEVTTIPIDSSVEKTKLESVPHFVEATLEIEQTKPELPTLESTTDTSIEESPEQTSLERPSLDLTTDTSIEHLPEQTNPKQPRLESTIGTLEIEPPASEKETTIELEGLDPRAIEDKILQAEQVNELQKAESAARKLAGRSTGPLSTFDLEHSRGE